MYVPADCPGIDSPSRSPFPILKTLLFIPFSLLHNIPRLSSELRIFELSSGGFLVGKQPACVLGT